MLLESFKIRAAIIDTRVNLDHPELIDKSIICKQINDQGVASYLTGNSDQIGHGTAICGILTQNNNVEITVFKVFDSMDEINEELLISVLEYLYLNEYFDILNLSLGIGAVSQYKILEQACRKIVDQGTIIVASYNNYGSVTYPAAFPFVIGVD